MSYTVRPNYGFDKEDPHRLFTLDEVMGHQYFEQYRQTRKTPELQLMRAVLEDAIYGCIFKCVLAKDRRYKRLFDDAYDWIHAVNWDGPFAFETICEMLGLNPTCIREGVVKWVKGVLQRKQRPGGVAVRKTPHAVSASPRISSSKAA